LRAAGYRGVIFASAIALAILSSPCIALAEPLQVTAISASAAIDARSGRPALNIRLADESRAAFKKFTETHVMEFMEMRLDGKTVAKAKILEPISTEFQVNMGNMEEARQAAARLNHAAIEVEVVSQ
jgi:preprotein translocase subunit SecD